MQAVQCLPGIEKGLPPFPTVELEFPKEILAIDGRQVLAVQNQFPLSKEMVQSEAEPVQGIGVRTSWKNTIRKIQKELAEFLFQFAGGRFAYFLRGVPVAI